MSAAEEVSTLMVQKFGVDPAAVQPEVSLHQLRMDSLALEEFRLLIEDRLEIDLGDAALTSRDTVGQLVELVHSKILV
ncbi:MAG TPA: phosphopantetheine-binding protein [Streptomyces sp.]|uniref:acyl carrier protein n=1 Tax=Streptomyces sp. H27-C3 TaxID=3046305 RepID=UPI0024BB9737|nr:phosphopantetheine-binding protein [Streptomyces sp. H27-C3]MDJ0460526.1 phosphopantetheine-binding protein [Streptomyces sp. H27-C3]HET6861197.1 phosphopantetheine-binding protein [Streptomyces sp.]